MAEPNTGTGLIHFIKSLFAKRHQVSLELKKRDPKKIHLEPKYWPEVKDYMETLQELIKTHTVEDDNVAEVNERITNYIWQQINKKGSIQDIKKRYLALDTLADRILVTLLGKLAGLKEGEGTRAEFSEATSQFKKRLAARQIEEIQNQENSE